MPQKAMRKSKKKLRLKRFHFGIKSRLIFMIVPMIIFLIVVFVCLKKTITMVDIYQLFYTESSNLNYIVCLKPNNYFHDDCLEKDSLYVANIIDYITTEFKYEFNISEMLDYNYKYNIIANISATEKGGDSTKKLYNKDEIILSDKTGTIIDTSFIIDEKIIIDYSKYNDLMTSFRKDYSILLNSSLTVTLNVELVGKYKNIDDPVMFNQNISLKIPLTEQTINIEVDYKNLDNDDVITIETKDERTLYVYYSVIGISSLGFVLLLIRLSLFLTKITKSKKTTYDHQLAKIMREYNQIIAETTKIPDTDDFKIIELKNFNELLDVRETFIKPIVFVKINSVKSWFMIYNNNEIYRFVLKEANIKLKNS